MSVDEDSAIAKVEYKRSNESVSNFAVRHSVNSNLTPERASLGLKKLSRHSPYLAMRLARIEAGRARIRDNEYIFAWRDPLKQHTVSLFNALIANFALKRVAATRMCSFTCERKALHFII